MKLLSRPVSNYARTLVTLHHYLAGVVRCFALFERPAEVVWAYVVRRAPRGGTVRLKNGWTIHLSRDPADIVTIFVVFAREDYGRVPPGSVVVDIGANIGVFALYAVFCGASRVLAYEPSGESYECLTRNIRENALDDVIVPHRLAVSSGDRPLVRFPRRSSVMNAMVADDRTDDVDEVRTTTLDAIVQPVERVDLVKIDAEGAEYDILFSTGAAAFGKIAALKLEYHRGRQDEIVTRLRANGLEPVNLTADNAVGGVIWFARAGA